MKEMKAAGEYTSTAFRKYRKFLLKQGESLRQAVEVATAKNTCLMCYEADYRGCHRRIVAEEIVNRSGLAVHHLAVTPKD